MDLRLLVLKGKPEGKELPIRVFPFVIGRGPECHLRPNSDMVSRLHCVLTVHGEEVRIRDLGSTNGTIVDGERLTEPLTLTDGDIFQVGPLVFQVVLRPTGAAPSPHAHPAATPAGETPVKQAAHEAAGPDDIVQWLISDTKNDVPSSGSGVFSGKTVFTTSPAEQAREADAEPVPSPPESVPQGGKARAGAGRAPGKPAEENAHKEWPHGGAAHAAEDMINQFLHRRPHK